MFGNDINLWNRKPGILGQVFRMLDRPAMERQAREKLVFSDKLLEQLNSAHDAETPLMEARRKALEGCMAKLNEQERKWVQLRYGRHGAVKEEAERTGVKMHKLYYALEKIRAQLLDCIGRTMRQEGWSEA